MLRNVTNIKVLLRCVTHGKLTKSKCNDRLCQTCVTHGKLNKSKCNDRL